MQIVCPGCLGVNRVPDGRLEETPLCGRCKAPIFGAKPLAVTAGQLERFLKRNELPLLVDFWAPWCGPCKVMAPAFEQAAVALEPRVQLLKLNTEENPAVAARFGIRSIPTLLLLYKGEELGRISGAMDARQLVAWSERLL